MPAACATSVRWRCVNAGALGHSAGAPDVALWTFPSPAPCQHTATSPGFGFSGNVTFVRRVPFRAPLRRGVSVNLGPADGQQPE